ncbi:MAG: hypothetical protein KIY12_05375 [Thermoplasmata archaeon]|uniref:CARDB domain-containing protein n=1 Tax=Candidatus Sysuiplasma superficiale TaxID=2823368 RepID=A0A8J8CHP7_9ARCH|nr:hypothetical protein [Candidatus Sysuiplasma superficiale]MBX8644138.1 hypothetical protein [Candidatus Sysuiplasma superficiale]MCL4346307.1 hypothetical protein [Candidatus Thermoplasmatota archaeon]MCL5437109.1 hypothetical protein [Candidatus Thermoplasmatota archaeon]
MNRRALTSFIAALMLLPFFLLTGVQTASTPAYASTPPLVVTLAGPDIVANGSTNTYYINITGGPTTSASYNYSYTATIHSANVTGSSVSPSTGKSSSGSFPVNITSTTDAGIMTVAVNATFSSPGVTVNKSVSFLIKVVHPVVIRVPIYNSGPSGIRNVPVSLFVDGSFVATQVVSIPAHSSVNVTFDWVSYSYTPGAHTVTVVIDSNSTLLFSNGARQTSFTIYIPGNTFVEIDDLLITGIIIAAFFFVLIYFRKPKPRK